MSYCKKARWRYPQESTRKCDDKFVGSFDEAVLDIHPVRYELIIGSDGLWGQWDETQSEWPPTQ
jgi:hypothetical protein